MSTKATVTLLLTSLAVLVLLLTTSETARADPLLCMGRVATIVGTEKGAFIFRTKGDDVIAALGGDDHIFPGAGDDIVCAGPGD